MTDAERDAGPTVSAPPGASTGAGGDPSTPSDAGPAQGGPAQGGTTGTAGSAGAPGAAGLAGPDASTPEPAPSGPGEDTLVEAFSGAHVYFGEPNRRMLDAEVSFPERGSYESITLDFALDCPDGGCDFWDRYGSLGVVLNPDAPAEEQQVVELFRFITPYRVTAGWEVDLTDLRPLLSGEVTLRVFIDTWVGPGHPQGAGWLVDATFDMQGGTPNPEPIAVTGIFNSEVVYGDPGQPISAQLPAVDIEVPEGTTAAKLRAFITGHGQGNANNCAEFCPREHTFSAGEVEFSRDVWRADCARTAVPGQAGTYTYPRAGWCPGADVLPWEEDVTEALLGGATRIAYAVEAYENTCRPDSQNCDGCVFNTGCEYNDSSHTQPVYRVSALVIAYR